MIDTNKIVPYEKNAKRHPDNQIDIIASSIDKFKFDQPIVIDENNVIIKGHGRLLGAKRLGLKSVPVIIRTDMTEAEKKASRLADNKSNESDWDWELLNVELDELKDLDIDIDWLEFDENVYYEPNVNPEIVEKIITQSEIDKKNEELTDKFKTEKNIKYIECPYCGESFGVDNDK